MKQRVKTVAIDGTGFETRHISVYYVILREKDRKNDYQTTTYMRYPYTGIVCDCASHITLAVVPGRGPSPDDKHFRPAVKQTAHRASVGTVLAGAGYDREAARVYARHEHGMRTLIPPTRGLTRTRIHP